MKLHLFARGARLSPEERALKAAVPFDPETQYAVIRSSICTGEKVAGFRNKQTGRFREVMFLRSDRDMERFLEIYELDSVQTEY